MTSLPLHIPSEAEPIPALDEADSGNKDLRFTRPLQEMLRQLRAHDNDEQAYLALWRRFVAEAGCIPSVTFDRDGETTLSFHAPCDSQSRHRSRWMHFLFEDLARLPGRRLRLMQQLARRGNRLDMRRADPRATTAAMRGFLAAGGSIMIDPDGYLIDDVTIEAPRFLNVIDDHAEAFRTYLDVRKRLRSDAQIKRAVRMLGTRKSGWIVLGAKQ